MYIILVCASYGLETQYKQLNNGQLKGLVIQGEYICDVRFYTVQLSDHMRADRYLF